MKRIFLVIIVLGLLPFIIATDTLTPEAPNLDVPGWMIYHVMKWKPLVDRWHEEFPNVPEVLVYSVIAKESQGFPYVTSGDGHGSVGLMQIIPRTWTSTEKKLKDPNINIYIGTWMLSNILERTEGDMRVALAVYNCGYKGVENNKCGTHGGYAYADDVLETFYPVFNKIVMKEKFAILRRIRLIEKLKYMDGY